MRTSDPVICTPLKQAKILIQKSALYPGGTKRVAVVALIAGNLTEKSLLAGSFTDNFSCQKIWEIGNFKIDKSGNPCHKS